MINERPLPPPSPVGREPEGEIVERHSSFTSLSSRASNSGPVMIVGLSKPIWRAISLAVAGVSPVTILIRIPARIHSSIAAGTSSRTGSEIAVTPKNFFPTAKPRVRIPFD